MRGSPAKLWEEDPGAFMAKDGVEGLTLRSCTAGDVVLCWNSDKIGLYTDAGCEAEDKVVEDDGSVEGSRRATFNAQYGTPPDKDIWDTKFRTTQLWAKGQETSDLPVDIHLTLSPESGEAPSDTLKLSVVTLDLDVNGDGDLDDLVDRVAYYTPGYQGGVPKVSEGTTFNNPGYVGQEMKLVLQGAGSWSGLDEIVFEFVYTSCYPGFCMNATDDKIKGTENDDDYSFRELENHRVEPGTMMIARTSVPFWCKDYGGYCMVLASLRKEGEEVGNCSLCIPRDEDEVPDNLADAWEADMILEWNDQYMENHYPFDKDFFSEYDDKENQDPDGTGPQDPHLTAGDDITCWGEYRGYILDCGGVDPWGNNAHPGGHKRLSPARKDYLIEVDRMEGVGSMPPPAQLGSYLNQCSALYNSALYGIEVCMYFALDEDDLEHNEFPDSSTLWSYADGYRKNERLFDFCHAILADCVTDPDDPGLVGITRGGAGGPFYVFVDSVANIASLRGLPFGQHLRSTFCHEASHSIMDTDNANGFDDWEHVEDPDSDGNYWEWDPEAEVWIDHGDVPDPQDVPVLMLNRWTVERHTNPLFCVKTRGQIDVKSFPWR